MAKLTDEMKEFIKNVKLCVAATSDKNGVPNVSYKGSLQVLDDEHFVFADIFSAKTRKNLKENNKICILVGDPQNMKGYQFVGEAELLDQGELFDGVCKGVASLNLPKPVYAVKIRINDIYPAPPSK